ncbi:putative aarF domain-containing protein kinase, chloroplastic isoform B [Glycine soja]|uniref:Putative aarF domain-containing protein kinase, chloroplastic isoform B n=1 Tax=Glycine soja TaxID=3848 RepID=A0A445GJ80_GLYSO|nr:putative aarF domain-containing protein kinase, chloroplastic isoform B [Glycine soja]
MLLLPVLSLSPSFPSLASNRYLQFRPRRSRRVVRCAAPDSGGDEFTAKSGYLFELSATEADSLGEYRIPKIAAVYSRKPLLVARRLVQTGVAFGKWFGLRYIDTLLDRSESMFQVRAAELRKILVELGPAYIKIAQAISSRADLIPPSYLDELSLLQDRISPFSSEVAFSMIEQELGLSLVELFSEISPEPVAAASLGQVYQARLRKTGQVVAVKVQRPGVQAAISLDILILRFMAGLIRRAGKFNTDLQAVVDEWASSLFREMDYNNEASNGIKFRNLYGSIPDVVVPLMYTEYTTRKVLVMEWIEGEKLSEVKDLYLIEVGVYCSFNQLLECGFYHADPHPGNLLRTYDGKLAYLDFGMTGEFKQELRDGFIEACLHLVNRDFDALAKDFVTLGLLPPTADKEAVTKALTGVFQNAVAKGVSNISFGDLLGNLGTTMYKFKFRIPSYFSLVIRSLAVLEGIAISFNPEYKVLGSTYPWIARKVLTDNSPQLKSSLETLLYKDGVFRIDRLESLVTESLRAKTEKAIVKQTEGTDSTMVMKEILSFTLTEKGEFVREIIVQEFAKGLDALGLATMETAAARVPFSSFFYSPLMTKEDIINLRNFRRLMLLLLGARRKEESSTVRFLFYLKRTTSIHFIIMYYFHFEGHLTFYLKFNLGSKDLSILMLKPIGLHTTLYYTKSRN